MPMMPFIGVRISWLMLARNMDFAAVASSARSFAACSSCSVSLRCRPRLIRFAASASAENSSGANGRCPEDHHYAYQAILNDSG